jgi:hypothetical protein
MDKVLSMKALNQTPDFRPKKAKDDTSQHLPHSQAKKPALF